MLGWGLLRLKTSRESGLSPMLLLLAFAAKIVAGLVYAGVQAHYYNGGDAYKYFKGGQVIYRSLWENPWYYLRLVFGKNGGFVDTPIYKYAYHTECWDHLGAYAFCRLNALWHLISGGYYSVHVLFMAFLMLLAGLNFYRVLQPLKLMPDKVLYVLIFLTPALLFWTGGVYKGGMVYLGLSCCLLATVRLAARNKFSAIQKSSPLVIISTPLNAGLQRGTKRRLSSPLEGAQGVDNWKKAAKLHNLFSLLIGLGLIGLFRNYLLLLLLPALAILFYTLKYPKHAGWKFVGVYLVGILALVLLSPILPINIYEVLAQRQWAFLAEWGGSDFNVAPLAPTLQSFAGFLPTALFNVSCRPFLWAADSAVQFLSAIGITLFWLVALLTFIFKKKKINWHPVQWFLLFYAMTNLLLVGILVSNSGTITRYRVIAIHFLILLLVSLIDFNRLRRPLG